MAVPSQLHFDAADGPSATVTVPTTLPLAPPAADASATEHDGDSAVHAAAVPSALQLPARQPREIGDEGYSAAGPYYGKQRPSEMHSMVQMPTDEDADGTAAGADALQAEDASLIFADALSVPALISGGTSAVRRVLHSATAAAANCAGDRHHPAT